STGMDAMTHAVECYVSNDSSPHEQATALHALRLIRDNLERAVHEPEDDDARGNMLVAASLAITINLGATHSMSHPCGGQFGVPHGVANAINLPHVIRFNAAAGGPAADGYRDVSEVLGLEARGPNDEVGDRLASHLADLAQSLELP